MLLILLLSRSYQNLKPRNKLSPAFSLTTCNSSTWTQTTSCTLVTNFLGYVSSISQYLRGGSCACLAIYVLTLFSKTQHNDIKCYPNRTIYNPQCHPTTSLDNAVVVLFPVLRDHPRGTDQRYTPIPQTPIPVQRCKEKVLVNIRYKLSL